MTGFVDFQELKSQISIEQVVGMLQLKLKAGNNQLRGPCPKCLSGGDRALVVTPAKGVFYCFANGKGGDLIQLVSHIREVPVKEAAAFIAERAGLTSTGTSTVNSSVPAKDGGKVFAPLSYLESEHPAVDAVGFDTEFAKKHGIGYAGKGILRGTVAIPFRDEKGNLLGYIGITDAKLPADFTPNVVAFPKSA